MTMPTQPNKASDTHERDRIICERFRIPPAAGELIDFFFTPQEQDFILAREEETFPAAVAEPAFIAREYTRGLICKADEAGSSYKLNSFYSFLDIFVVSNKEQYDTLSREQKKALDDWYFDAYYDGLDKEGLHPTSDRILPLDEMLDLIDKDDRPVYLNNCDCRALTGDCGLPIRTCISYRAGINSFVDRGLSERIDKERAKQVVRDADRAGLMHTVNEGGICNCCGDCCYLFRSQERMNSTGVWPATEQIVRMDEETCISCGACLERCHFNVFTFDAGQKVQSNPAACVGCGVCVSICPSNALELVKR